MHPGGASQNPRIPEDISSIYEYTQAKIPPGVLLEYKKWGDIHVYYIYFADTEFFSIEWVV